MHDLDRIELHAPRVPIKRSYGKLPLYEITSIFEGGGEGHLANISVKPSENSKDKYDVVRFFPLSNQKAEVIGKNYDLDKATKVAYQNARETAEDISAYNHVPLTDQALDDEAEADRIVEDAEFHKELYGGKKRNLESRVGVFIFSTLAGIALSVLSIRPTGNVVSDLTQTSQGLFGLTFFVIGLAGLVFGKN